MYVYPLGDIMLFPFLDVRYSARPLFLRLPINLTTRSDLLY